MSKGQTKEWYCKAGHQYTSVCDCKALRKEGPDIKQTRNNIVINGHVQKE